MTDLSARNAVRASLLLFPRRQRRRLKLAVGLAVSTGILDVVGVLLLGLVAALGSSAIAHDQPPRLIRRIVSDLGLAGSSTATVLTVVALAASVFLLGKSAAALYVNRRILRFIARRQAEISAGLTRAMLAQPLLDVQRRASNVVAYSITDGVGYATINLLGSAVIGLTEGSMLIILGVTLFAIDPLVTLGAALYFGALVLVMQRGLGPRIGRAGVAAASSSIAGRSQVQEALGTFREIFVLDRRDRYAERVAVTRRIYARASADVAFITLVPKYVLDAGLVLGALALAATQFAWSDPTRALSTITLFLAASTRILPSILRLQQAVLSLRAAAGGSAQTYELAAELDWDPDDDTSPTLRLGEGLSAGRSEFAGYVRVRNVSFSYTDRSPKALDNVSFEARAGSSVAIVGPSGAGKSTLADIVIGALRPDSGQVTISGVSPREAIGRWPGLISYVPQRVYLADGDIRQNVALGLRPEEINDSAVWDALERAHLSDFVRALPQELETQVGEYGTRLSGGQQQRLGLARALFTQPAIMLLDEATSALDAETEHAITETLRRLQGEVTTIIVAHRLSTVFSCDVVLYLEDGKLICAGSFDEVRGAVPRFERQAQLSGL